MVMYEIKPKNLEKFEDIGRVRVMI